MHVPLTVGRMPSSFCLVGVHGGGKVLAIKQQHVVFLRVCQHRKLRFLSKLGPDMPLGGTGQVSTSRD